MYRYPTSGAITDDKLAPSIDSLQVEIQRLKVENELLKKALRLMHLGHTRGCSFDNAPGDEGDCCDCGLSYRKGLVKNALGMKSS